MNAIGSGRLMYSCRLWWIFALVTALKAPSMSGTPSERLECVRWPRECNCDLPKRVCVKVKSNMIVRGGGRQSVESQGFCKTTSSFNSISPLSLPVAGVILWIFTRWPTEPRIELSLYTTQSCTWVPVDLTWHVCKWSKAWYQVFFGGIDWFDYWVLGLDYQSIW
jgi:hypothetical protein